MWSVEYIVCYLDWIVNTCIRECSISPLGKLAGRAIDFACCNFIFIFLLWAKLSQYPLDRFSRSFHQMEDICVNFLDLVQFFRFLEGRCHGNQFSGKISYPPALITLSFRNGISYRYLNVRVNSVNDASMLRENFVKFGPVVFELSGVENENCVVTRPKFHNFRSFGILAFWNAFEYHNFDFSMLISNHFCTSCENLVRFELVTPNFRRKKLYGQSR